MSSPRELHCYEYVNQAYDRVREAILADPLALFQRATNAAVGRAQDVATQLRVNVGAVEIGTGVAIHVSSVASDTHPALHVPLTRLRLEWKAVQSAGLFPSMEAELSVYPLSSSETQLDLRGEYRPPLGLVGTAVDSVILHRVAEASVHRFLRDVSERLRQELGA